MKRRKHRNRTFFWKAYSLERVCQEEEKSFCLDKKGFRPYIRDMEREGG